MHEHPLLGDVPWIANLRGERDLTIDADYVRAGPPGHPLIRGDQIDPVGAYSSNAARALKERSFDRKALAARRLPYERLDQLVIDLLLGAE